jgi:transposase InsO family protein
VYYIPELKSNIISLGQLEEKGFKYVGENGRLCVFDQNRTLLISAPRTNNRLYLAKFMLDSPVSLLAQSEDVSWRWHARFGHLNFRALRDLGAKNMVEGMPTVKSVEKVCDGCVLGKQHRTPFPQVTSYRAKKGLELVHADLCGHITPKTLGGASYFLLVVDDHSRYMWVDMLKTKDQALTCFKKIKMRAQLESGNKLKALRTDRGGEFTFNLFSVFCSDGGIKYYTTTPYSPQQNGVVERRNQTI